MELNVVAVDNMVLGTEPVHCMGLSVAPKDDVVFQATEVDGWANYKWLDIVMYRIIHEYLVPVLVLLAVLLPGLQLTKTTAAAVRNTRSSCTPSSLNVGRLQGAGDLLPKDTTTPGPLLVGNLQGFQDLLPQDTIPDPPRKNPGDLLPMVLTPGKYQ
ncbi:uncharacterized protein [Cherax quadricarinatus]|uniref:uncharacterized protein n=1 Tax=Cherax quadricarinatus TaxID=27406 RepID=UPI002379CEA3|nr:uncharacterized protein LOC128699251 [Cherax quadricarinatus]